MRAGAGFRSFAQAFYAAPGVAPACLALQDRDGADVNLVLFALWTASRGHVLSVSEAARACALCAPWQAQVVRRLRAVRRWLKAPPADFAGAAAQALRARVMAIELAGERLQLAALTAGITLRRAAPPDAALARRNLATYAEAAAISPGAAEVDLLAGRLAP